MSVKEVSHAGRASRDGADLTAAAANAMISLSTSFLRARLSAPGHDDLFEHNDHVIQSTRQVKLRRQLLSDATSGASYKKLLSAWQLVHSIKSAATTECIPAHARTNGVAA
eukprot:jgi/Chlat1/3359/Chrsp23S03782